MHVLSISFLILISGLFAVTSLSVYVTLDSITLSHLHVHILVLVCVFTIFLSFRCLVLCILNNVNVRQLYRVSLSIRSSPKWGILKLGGR
jgi:hypothetical protein